MLGEIEKKKVVNLGRLEKYTSQVQEYVEAKKLETESRIDKIDADITTENLERKAEDSKLLNNINSEESRARAAEAELQSSIDAELTRALGEEALIRLEVASRFAEEANAHESVKAEVIDIAGLMDTQSFNDIKTYVADALNGQTAFTIDVKQELDSKITNLDAKSTKIESDLTKEIIDRIEADNALRDSIDTHIVQYQFDNAKLNSHVNNTENPHRITFEQIGAASADLFNSISERVGTAERDIAGIKDRVSATETDIADLQYNTLALVAEKVNLLSENLQTIVSDLAIEGDISAKNFTVKGNLQVKGTTTTVEHETIAVKDNLLVVNSDGEDLGTALAGIAIKTDDDKTYGIVYDKNTDSVSLGQGTISNGDFVFNSGETKPILTRDISENLKDGHVFIWDSEKNIAVDGGDYSLEALKEVFSTREENSELIKEIQQLANTDNTIGALGRVTIIENELSTEIKPDIESIKTNISEVEKSLTDEATTRLEEDSVILNHIDEVKSSLNTHAADTENPHKVNWAQIHTTSDVLATSAPKANGTVAVGTSTRVSREDHVHPTDTTRAPIEHTFTDATTDYGKATEAVYGHVKYDSAVSSGKDGVVSAEKIKSFVEGEIQKLNFAETLFTASETINKISESEGKIAIEKQPIAIAQSQVSGLEDRLNDLENYVNVDENTLLQSIINTLRNQIANNTTEIANTQTVQSTIKNNVDSLSESLDTEVTSRTNADTAVALQALKNLETTAADLQAQINAIEQDYQANTTNVSFSSDLTDGTKIGTITINGTSTDIFAPNEESNNTASPTIIDVYELPRVSLDDCLVYLNGTWGMFLGLPTTVLVVNTLPETAESIIMGNDGLPAQIILYYSVQDNMAYIGMTQDGFTQWVDMETGMQLEGGAYGGIIAHSGQATNPNTLYIVGSILDPIDTSAFYRVTTDPNHVYSILDGYIDMNLSGCPILWTVVDELPESGKESIYNTPGVEPITYAYMCKADGQAYEWRRPTGGVPSWRNFDTFTPAGVAYVTSKYDSHGAGIINVIFNPDVEYSVKLYHYKNGWIEVGADRIDKLEAYVGTIPTYSTATDIASYIQEQDQYIYDEIDILWESINQALYKFNPETGNYEWLEKYNPETNNWDIIPIMDIIGDIPKDEDGVPTTSLVEMINNATPDVQGALEGVGRFRSNGEYYSNIEDIPNPKLGDTATLVGDSYEDVYMYVQHASEDSDVNHWIRIANGDRIYDLIDGLDSWISGEETRAREAEANLQSDIDALEALVSSLAGSGSGGGAGSGGSNTGVQTFILSDKDGVSISDDGLEMMFYSNIGENLFNYLSTNCEDILSIRVFISTQYGIALSMNLNYVLGDGSMVYTNLQGRIEVDTSDNSDSASVPISFEHIDNAGNGFRVRCSDPMYIMLLESADMMKFKVTLG